MKQHKLLITVLVFISICPLWSQSTKTKSYIISKNENYTINVKSDKPDIQLFAEEKKWVGDKEDFRVASNRINYSGTFEEISDVEAFSVSPDKQKRKVKTFQTAEVEIESVFYHDMKYKSYVYEGLTEGSETYTSYRKQYRKPQLLDRFYFKDDLDCKDAKISLKVYKDVEIGYTLHGDDTDKIAFTTNKEGDYTIYNWELKNAAKEERFDESPPLAYYSPHLIFYIKSYKDEKGVTQNVLGSIDNLYKFYCETIKDINKADETALKAKTNELVKGLTTDFDKAKSIFNFVQGNVNYVAFEDGMGGFIPREAAEIFQKRYGDCKDMANLLNEMLNYAGIESHLSWIGTRHNNYTYEKVPTPIVDNHMIAVAKINGKYEFLDATGRFCIFPSETPFIQGKQALLKMDGEKYTLLNVPTIAPEINNTAAKVHFAFDGMTIKGAIDLEMTGFEKSKFVGHYKSIINKDEMLRDYLSRFIAHIVTSGITVGNNDLSPDPVSVKTNFMLDKWTRELDGKLLVKPILFFPYSDSRIDTEKRTAPYEFDFKKSYTFDYELEVPTGYAPEFIPENYKLDTDVVTASITYKKSGSQIVISQRMSVNTLLLERKDFDAWNAAIKDITKHYNQNIILGKI